MNINNLTLEQLKSLRGRVNQKISSFGLNKEQVSQKMKCIRRGLGWKVCKGRVKCVDLGKAFKDNVSK